MARHTVDFTFRSILCAVDYSVQSAAALRHAAAIATRSGGRITVMFVKDPLLVAGDAAAFDARISTRELRSFVRQSLSPSRSKAIRYLVALGTPAQEILKTATRLRSDLVVVGSEGLGVTTSALFGSTTQQLMRKTHVPVLAVPRSGRKGPKTPARDWPGKWLLAPNDLGGAAEADAAQAGTVARAFGAGLILVHVMPPIHVRLWSRADLATHYRIAIETAQEWLDQLRAKVGDDVMTTCRAAVGNPADEIAALAADHHIGLVVLTVRGRGGLLGSLPGMVAHHVLSHGLAPVLVLPPHSVPVHGRAAA